VVVAFLRFLADADELAMKATVFRSLNAKRQMVEGLVWVGIG
jgi:hypothetical protein